MSASSDSYSELEIDDNLLLGDLGYGSGLKPGGIPNFCTAGTNFVCKNKLPHFAYLCQSKDRKNTISLTELHSFSSDCSDVCSGNSEEISELIEEERETFTLELKKIFQLKRNRNSFDSSNDTPCEKVISNLKEELKLAYEKIEQLTSDLEISRKLLYGKYKASEVLVKQLNAIEQENKSIGATIKNECAELRKEVNSLQFALDCTESQLTESQCNWLERYNRIALENTELSTTVKEQSNAIKSLIASRMALSHERDELMVLLDAKERLSFQRSSSLSSEDSCPEFTSVELGLLGACSCRGKQQEPCRCARAACSKQKHIINLNKEVENLEKLLNETHNALQAFQNAFEEQLKRNRNLIKSIYANKMKSGVKVSFTNFMKRSTENKYEIIIESLINLLCDKNEALLHQRLLSKFLAKKLKDIENSDPS